MVRPLSRTGLIPHESIVYREFQRGAESREIADMFNVPVMAMKSYIDCRRRRWEEHPPRMLESDHRKIVHEVEVYENHAFRRVHMSLPRLSFLNGEARP